MARVICPFCCTVHDFTKSQECPKFQWKVPPAFIQGYEAFPPIWLMTVGFKQYGKTTYLSSLAMLLEGMVQVVDSMWFDSLDTYSFKKMREDRTPTDKAPDSTPVGPIRPLLFRVGDMKPLGSRSLVMYDLAGESFEVPENVGESAPALREVNTVWFLVSLPNLQEDIPRRTIMELLQVYLAGMDELRIDVRGWNLIVIYTKADDDVAAFPDDLREYLLSDPLTPIAQGVPPLDAPPAFDTAAYLIEMQRVSDRLRDFTRTRVPSGAGFINRAKAKGMDLTFSVISALGHPPDDKGNLKYEKSPRRVLDPLLWALTLERKLKARSIRLIIDAEWQNDSLSKDLVADLWRSLTNHGEVTTHVLGQIRPVSASGQSPPESFGGRKRQRLMGPILQACSPEDRLLVLTSGPVLDLADFQSSGWSDRLLIVSTEDELSFDWNHTEICRSGEDIGFLVDRLLSLWNPGDSHVYAL
jgi:double-GTPase-like protein